MGFIKERDPEDGKTRVLAYCSACGAIDLKQTFPYAMPAGKRPGKKFANRMWAAALFFLIGVLCRAFTSMAIPYNWFDWTLTVGILGAVFIVIYAFVVRSNEQKAYLQEAARLEQLEEQDPGFHFHCNACGNDFSITDQQITKGSQNPKRYTFNHLLENGAIGIVLD